MSDASTSQGGARPILRGRGWCASIRGRATILSEMGHCLHEIFTWPARLSSPSP